MNDQPILILDKQAFQANLMRRYLEILGFTNISSFESEATLLNYWAGVEKTIRATSIMMLGVSSFGHEFAGINTYKQLLPQNAARDSVRHEPCI